MIIYLRKIMASLMMGAFILSSSQAFAADEFRILALDGGGVRGIIPATLLDALEKSSGKPITELFDMIVGTSTGGLIALYLNIPDDSNTAKKGKQKYSAEYIVKIYKDLSAAIFKNTLFRKVRTLGGLISSKYSAKPLELLLQSPSHFGALRLKDAVIPVLVTSKNIETGASFDFSSVAAKQDPKNNDYPFWLAARATSAAPTFFKPIEVKEQVLVDGGVGSNNPALDGVLAAKRELKVTKPIVVLSLGTGVSDEVKRVDSKGLFAGGLDKILSSTVKTLFTAQEFASTEATKEIIGHDNMYRVAPVIPNKNSSMDDTNPLNLLTLENLAKKVAESDEVFNRFSCEVLKVSSRCR